MVGLLEMTSVGIRSGGSRLCYLSHGRSLGKVLFQVLWQISLPADSGYGGDLLSSNVKPVRPELGPEPAGSECLDTRITGLNWAREESRFL